MKKKYSNNGQSYDDIMQNRFTSYVEKAMVRNRMRYYAGFMKQLEHEVPLTEEDFNEELAAEEEIVSEDFQPEMFENIKLLEALNRRSQEDLTIINFMFCTACPMSALPTVWE